MFKHLYLEITFKMKNLSLKEFQKIRSNKEIHTKSSSGKRIRVPVTFGTQMLTAKVDSSLLNGGQLLGFLN